MIDWLKVGKSGAIACCRGHRSFQLVFPSSASISLAFFSWLGWNPLVILNDIKGILALCIPRVPRHRSVDVLMSSFRMIASMLLPVPLDESSVLSAQTYPP
jgi:hypothetical protein